MRHAFPCYTCGGHNPAGQAHCSWCGNRFYYNCPHCGAWVDNSYSDCPCCRRDLNWLKPGTGDSNTSRSPALMFSLIATVLLFAVAFILIENNSSPARPSYLTGSTPAMASPSNLLPVTLAPQSSAFTQVSQGNTTYTPPASPQAPDTSGITAITEFYIPMNSTANNAAAGNNGATATPFRPAASSYLQQLAPQWGHCSGGSCRSAGQ